MTTLYKTLFEVKFLHEFYHTDSKGESVFDLPDQPARMNYLQNKFTQNRASVNDDLIYEVPASMQPVFDNYQLHLLTTYSGFKIAVAATAETLTDGTRVFTPKIKIPADLNILVSLVKKNNLIESLSNAPMDYALPVIRYFTNEHFNSTRTFPFLTAAIPAFDSTNKYEQGELASYGLNDTRQFYFDGSSDQWITVKGNHFVNKSDMILITPVFNYAFNTGENITRAHFILKNSDGVIVRTAEEKSDHPLRRINLNFNPSFNEEKLVCLPKQKVTEKSIYTLEVTLNESITKTHTVIFWDNDYQFKNYWGVVNIKNDVTTAGFELLDASGRLKIRKLSSGTWEPAPVFEIAIKSRLTYWRYQHNKHRKLLISSDITDFVERMDNDLILKKPRPVTYIPTPFKAPDDTFHQLPNPVAYDKISNIDNRLFLDIAVSESKLFPSAPG